MRGLTKFTVSIASAATLGGYLAYRRELAALRARLTEERRLAETALGPVEYGREGEGEPALVVHGAGGGFDQGLFLGRETLGAGYDLIAPSRFGYLGAALPDDPSPAAQADAHAALLDALGVEKAVVLGVSAGAPSAIELALRHPARVSALILMVPRAYAPEVTVQAEGSMPSRAVLKLMLSGADFGYWLAMHLARRSLVRFLGVPPRVEEAALPAERARVSGIIRSILPLSERVSGIVAEAQAAIGPWPLERIAAPTLVVTASDDLFNTEPPARFTAERIPGAELLVLDSGGHLMVGQGDAVRGRVAAFLAGRPRELRQAA